MVTTEKVLIDKLDQFIGNNLDKSEVSTDIICRELGLSRTHLHRILKENTQLSTTLYIRKVRLEKAKNLLSTTDLRISEIVYAVGMNNHANFSKYFIEEFNVSPSGFRKQVQVHLVAHLEEQTPIQVSVFTQSKEAIRFAKKPVSRKIYAYAFMALLVIWAIAYYFIIQSQKTNNNSRTAASIENNEKYFAIVYAGLGNKENCLKYLELATQQSNSPNYLKTTAINIIVATINITFGTIDISLSKLCYYLCDVNTEKPIKSRHKTIKNSKK